MAFAALRKWFRRLLGRRKKVATEELVLANPRPYKHYKRVRPRGTKCNTPGAFGRQADR